ncbi:MAG: polyhydroxyalkanoate synthase [Alcanivoracaceae bacterium]|uniref:alpha/beta fold hydrolase n=1 Tax=Alcanivorax sp. MD8A TaxID=1177157 RepID=UPI000C5CFBC0|nr:alpha/beta fold hydrolase [Alcanivorax sp. MD8A]MAX55722.1 polyhydroxyalkanoate synthase [Alcanivoracaceae bacterium]MCG8438881.1 alpha/beta fold hydrolase [Pseudomonadales bacterium]PNE01731.1 polyhydroxyalkanoate synthase [Alcanivorax sp. MD8A]
MATSSRFRTSLRAVGHIVERRRHPDRFINVDKTPWDEIYRDGIMAVRHYSLPPGSTIELNDDTLAVQRERHRIPLILVPALGIHCWTYDLMPNRSMVKYLMARGYDVYLVDWGKPSQAEHGLDLDTYVNRWLPAAVDAVCEHAEVESVNLMGYCMGGLLCLMYLGGHEDSPVQNLITIASPVNFHKSGPFGKAISLAAIPSMKAHDWFKLRLKPLDDKLFHIPAGLLAFGFKMTNPPGVVQAYMDLIRNLGDREYVTEYMTMGQWFNDMVDYPGAVVREVIEKMILANSLARGRIRIGGRSVDFSTIKQDLLAFAGTTDNIVSLRAAREVMNLVGSRDKRFEEVPGGHAGVFSGSKAPDHAWRISADWLATRSD